MKKQHLAVLGAVIAYSIFGFSFMFTRIALGTITAGILLMLRFLLAFAAINVVVLAVRGRDDLPDWLHFNLRGKPILPLIGLGILQPVLYYLCENYGVAYTNATVSGVIIALIPIIAMMVGILVLHEKPKVLQIVFAVISIVGVAMMTVGQSQSGTVQPIGVLLLIGAAVMAAIYNTLSRKISTKYSPLESTYVMMGTGALVFTVMGLIEGCEWQMLATPSLILPLLYLSILSSILAFLMLNLANSGLPVAQATAFANLSTVLSLFAGVVFLGEPFSLQSLIASVLIMVGIIGVQKAA